MFFLVLSFIFVSFLLFCFSFVRTSEGGRRDTNRLQEAPAREIENQNDLGEKRSKPVFDEQCSFLPIVFACFSILSASCSLGKEEKKEET
jgi:hypothetical protein